MVTADQQDTQASNTCVLLIEKVAIFTIFFGNVLRISMSEKTLLSYFWDLAATNENIRINAAVNLIQYLRSAKKSGRNIQNNVRYEIVMSFFILCCSLFALLLIILYMK